MMKIYFLVLVGILSISMIFAQEARGKTCLARGSECVGKSLQCCKGSTCMYYADRCVGNGIITPDEPQEPQPAPAEPKTCLPRGSKCVGASAQCCKPTTCMFYANKCVGDGLVVPDGYPYLV